MSYIEMKHSYKRYQTGETEIVANNDISFSIERGELVVILGASGAGKSTVLNILGGMDSNSEGEVLIDGKNIANYTIRELTRYR
ncbi:TPA: ATP-binding cassette domain-containing protein, partial [Streptococcus agalactiae]